MGRIFFAIYICLLSSFFACYTSIKHPQVTSQSQYFSHEDINVVDNCAECHSNTLNASAILPAAAYDDQNWQFYSASAWWQDGVYIQPQRPDSYVSPTGPRLRGDNPNSSNRAVRTSAPPGPSLGKVVTEQAKDATEEEEKDNRRNFQRRKETQKEKVRDSKRKPRSK
jgi:hypothetical protein